MKLEPTAEQLVAMDLFAKLGSFAVEAGAGTGKTSTLRMLAGADPVRRGQYLAFNRSIVREAADSLPDNVRANTVHSLAFRAVGKRYAHRLEGRRMRSAELARRLNMDPIWLDAPSGRKPLQPSYLASLVMRSIGRFCQTADAEPGPEHVPYVDGIDGIEDNGRRGMANNRMVRAHVAPALVKAWADLSDPQGQLRFDHGHYLKLWERSEPYVGADYIEVDEAQDVSPVMLSIVTQQDHAQLVFVGDSQQEIYSWMGAVNALEKVPAEDRCYLTQSFRFGDEIATVANVILERLAAPIRLRGTAALPSRVGPLGASDAILCRTNAQSVTEVLKAIGTGQPVHLLGGGAEVLSFARAANELMQSGFTPHPELACFRSWTEVLDYVAQDPSGGELALLVRLITDFGCEVIEKALANMPPEGDGVLTVSTAHKAKGREWNRVKIAEDFDPAAFATRGLGAFWPDGQDDHEEERAKGEELRLCYVACTRARRELDPGPLAPVLHPAPTLFDQDEKEGK